MQKLPSRFSKREDILIYIGFSFQILKSLENHIWNHVAFLNLLAKNHVDFTIAKVKSHKFVDFMVKEF